MEYYAPMGRKYLVLKTIDNEASAPANTNHILLIDRSQSMGWTIDKLIDHTIEFIDGLNIGDGLSIGWFSTEGKFDFIVRNHIIGEASKARIAALMMNYRSVVGLTCFSEILAQTKEVITEAQALNPGNVSLIFFTDGCPVVNNYQRELRDIKAHLYVLSGMVDQTLLIGYGDYYNRELMREMARITGGTLMHASNIYDYKRVVPEFMRTVTGRVTVELPTDAEAAFYLQAGMPTTIATGTVPTNISEVFFTAYRPIGKEAPLLDGRYAQAALLSQDGRINDAIDLLGEVGDVYFVTKLTNAFTVKDFGEIEKELMLAAEDEKWRFRYGYDPQCVPVFDALSVMDVLMELERVEAKFWPYHPKFYYKRTGLKSKRLEGYPEFQPTTNEVPFSLTFHEDRANVSIKAYIEGTVDLSEEADDYNLPRYFSTNVYRNYSIITDGILNVEQIVVTIPDKDLVKRLHSEGVLVSENPEVLDLSSLPLINRSHVEEWGGCLNCLIDDLEEELTHKAELKVYKYFLKSLEPVKVIEGYNEDQQQFLLSQGVKEYGYAPPMEAVEPEDYYLAKAFVVKCKGVASLPAVDAVMNKMANGKTLTPREQRLEPAISLVTSANAEFDADRLKKWIKEANEAMRVVRNNIQLTKLAVIVGKAWFEEIKRADGVEYEGWVFSFKDDIKVKY